MGLRDMKQLEAVVYGRVQGVSFRYYTKREALRLGVTGWVANRRDGTVKVVAQGSAEALAQLIQFLHQGPSMAVVDKVKTNWVEATGSFTQFNVRWL
jgi:acylphosphatase